MRKMRVDRIALYRVCNPVRNLYTAASGTGNFFHSIAAAGVDAPANKEVPAKYKQQEEAFFL